MRKLSQKEAWLEAIRKQKEKYQNKIKKRYYRRQCPLCELARLSSKYVYCLKCILYKSATPFDEQELINRLINPTYCIYNKTYIATLPLHNQVRLEFWDTVEFAIINMPDKLFDHILYTKALGEFIKSIDLAVAKKYHL